jgi:outer membrane immunogenic protein
MGATMGSRFWTGLATVTAVAAGAGAVDAADLAVKAPVYKAPPVILSDWAGFYIGVHAGYGWADTKFDPSVNVFDAKPKGGLVGGHAGYNWQYGSVVAGFEIDVDGADINSPLVLGPLCRVGGPPCPPSNPPGVKFDLLATARARLGYAVLPNLLAYGTGGAAWGHSEMTAQSQTVVSADADNFGWVAGAGLEYHLWHGFIARAEYLHYDFAKTTYSFTVPVNASTAIDVVRGGLSYKF